MHDNDDPQRFDDPDWTTRTNNCLDEEEMASALQTFSPKGQSWMIKSMSFLVLLPARTRMAGQRKPILLILPTIAQQCPKATFAEISSIAAGAELRVLLFRNVCDKT